jgi:hypothetical protein
MAVVCEKGLKNKNIPINMGTLIFKAAEIFSIVFCSANLIDFEIFCAW